MRRKIGLICVYVLLCGIYVWVPRDAWAVPGQNPYRQSSPTRTPTPAASPSPSATGATMPAEAFSPTVSVPPPLFTIEALLSPPHPPRSASRTPIVTAESTPVFASPSAELFDGGSTLTPVPASPTALWMQTLTPAAMVVARTGNPPLATHCIDLVVMGLGLLMLLIGIRLLILREDVRRE